MMRCSGRGVGAGGEGQRGDYSAGEGAETAEHGRELLGEDGRLARLCPPPAAGVSTDSVSPRYQGGSALLCVGDAHLSPAHPRQPDRPPRAGRLRRPHAANCWSPTRCSPTTRPRTSCSSTGRAGSARACCCARSAAAARQRRLDAVRDRRARPLAGAGRDRARAGRRLGGRAPAGPARHLRAHERARRPPARDAAAVAAGARGGGRSPSRDDPSAAGSRAAGRA